MKKVFSTILDTSEVWALLIPLFQLLFKPKQPRYLRPVIVYLFVALLLNLAVDILAAYNLVHTGNERISNNPLYNIHSIVRFFCFSYFFILLRQPFFKFIKKILVSLFFLFLVINFGFEEDLFYTGHISGTLFSTEAFFLLVCCMLYYLSQLKGEVASITGSKDFLVVTGLAIYVAANFFVFLFYVPMITENPQLAANMWDVHNVAYILLCIFISKAFYATSGN